MVSVLQDLVGQIIAPVDSLNSIMPLKKGMMAKVGTHPRNLPWNDGPIDRTAFRLPIPVEQYLVKSSGHILRKPKPMGVCVCLVLLGLRGGSHEQNLRPCPKRRVRLLKRLQ